MRIPAEQFLTFRAYGAPPVVVALAAQGAFRGLMDTKTPLYAVGKIMEIVLAEMNKQQYTVFSSVFKKNPGSKTLCLYLRFQWFIFAVQWSSRNLMMIVDKAMSLLDLRSDGSLGLLSHVNEMLLM
jgi:hypothetical protein